MKKILLNFFLVLLMIGSNAYAQNNISGRVTGKDDGSPLAGVSVTIKGTKNGTQTGPDGRFSLNASSGSTLVFTYLGYITSEVPASANMAVALTSALNELSEVIVVPYGTAKRETFTGSAASISAKELVNRPITNPLSALAGVAPGVQVNPSAGQPGSSPSIRIRGITSINSSNDPLYIVDGVQYEGTLSAINPEDIENISVLKDAATTALYGARAANGVISITTKRGKRGAGQLNVKATAGVNFRGIPEYDRLDAYQYYPMEWMAYRNSLVYAATVANRLSVADASMIASGLGTRNAAGLQVLGGRTYLDISQTLGSLIQNGVYTQSNNPFNVPSTQIVDVNGKINPNAQLRYDDLDWLKPALRTSNRQDYNLSYNGATDKTDYYTSLGYLNEQGFANKSDFKRLTGRLNVNTQATKWLKVGVNMTGTNSNANTVSGSTGGSSYINPFFFARGIGPVYNVYAHNPVTGAYLTDATGQRIYDLGGLTALGVPGRASGASPGRHVIQEIELNEESNRRTILSTRAYGEITFLKHFKFTTNLSADYTNQYNTSYQNQVVGDGAPGGRSRKYSTMNTYYNMNQLLEYGQTINKHTFNVLAGHENNTRRLEVLDGSRNTQLTAGNPDLANYTTTSNLTSYTDKDNLEGYFSRVSYDYDQKYLFSANLRRDASSRFARDVRWGTFGGVSLGWRLDREDFLRNASWIDVLKLRSSYGTLGNYRTQNGGDTYYPSQTLYDIRNNAAEPGFYAATLIGNPQLKWEVQKTFDVGVEFAFFKNRLNGTIEVFDKRSSNLLFAVPLPLSSGYSSQFQNIGEMYNRGLEITLGGDPVRTKNFTWNLNVNAAFIKNRITKMPAETPTIIRGINRLEVGRSVYDHYTRLYAGVDPSDGAALYVPLDGVTTNLRTINGVNYTTSQTNAKLDYTGKSSIPTVSGGITNSFNYKAFSLSIVTNYQLGGSIFDSNYQGLMSVGSYGSSLHKDILKSWMNPGDVSNIPRIDNANSADLNATSSRWETSASYLYIRSAVLNYSLPSKLMSKIAVKNARVFVSGENLYLFSARKGMDPTYDFAGTVSNTYVPQRTITLGLNFAL